MIDRQVAHLMRLVDELLDVSRIGQGRIALRKEPVDLAKVIGHGVETVRPLVEARRPEPAGHAARRAGVGVRPTSCGSPR